MKRTSFSMAKGGLDKVSREIAFRDELMNRRDILKLAGTALAGAVGVPASPAQWLSTSHFLAATSSNVILAADTADQRRLLFPMPQELKILESYFALDDKTSILLPPRPSASDLYLSHRLREELSEWHNLQVVVQQVDQLPETGRYILMGLFDNPLVLQGCARLGISATSNDIGEEGYLLRVDERIVLIAGSDEAGAFYGFQSLRQLISKSSQGIQLPGLQVRDRPSKPFRGVKLYLPGRNHIPFFKRFVRDFMALYKYNKLIMELNACMRLDRHPELNAGWVEFARDTNYSRRNYPPGVPHEMEVNSSHQDTADGGFLEKDEVADLVRWTQQNHIEVIPEIPSLTHSFYLLAKHRDLAQTPGMKWPDTYCACDPESYKLLFEVMDEYIEVMKPKMIHTGHDEWFAAYGVGPCCKDKDPGEVYGQDLRKIHDYLAGKGIHMAVWGDYLLEKVRGKGMQKRKAPDGWEYSSPGAMAPDQVKQLVPNDILIFNWFWKSDEGGEPAEAELEQLGFQQIYGNMDPSVPNYPERSNRSTLIGGAPSSWAATTEFNIGKDLLRDILGCSSLLWSKQPLGDAELSALTQALIPETRLRLNGSMPPSETGDSVVPLDISSAFNFPLRETTLNVDLRGLKTGRVSAGKKIFDLAGSPDGRGMVMVGTEGKESNPIPREVSGIRIGQDATSLIFLHSCAKPATNKEAYRLIWDFDDSADLLGWYEIVYEDGLPEVIPVRYGVNILEWNWGKKSDARTYCYGADLVACGQDSQNPLTFFALEWKNPRLGKIIREVRLKGTSRFRGAVPGFENAFGDIIPNNAIILKAISFVKAR